MDPSDAICTPSDSFISTSTKLHPESFDNWYSHPLNLTLLPNYEKIPFDSSPSPSLVNLRNYQSLQTIKDSFDDEGFIPARDATNPYELIGRSIFYNRASIKLANIDSVLHVTPDIFTFDRKQSNSPFTFCDVAAGPGGFTQYLQYRYPLSIGYGMTLSFLEGGLDWKPDILDMSRFNIFYGNDKTGNLYSNWDQFTSYVTNLQPQGVDLVTADGGFDLEDSSDPTLYNRQEFLSSRLLLTQSLVGIGCCKVGGNFVVKVFDTVTTISTHIIFLLSLCFDRITIFKPVSSRPANAEKYLVCIHRKENIDSLLLLLSDAARSYTDVLYLNSLFSTELPSTYRDWLTRINNLSTIKQLNSAKLILQHINGDQPQIKKYDLDKFLTIWNLPDTPPQKFYRKKGDNRPPQRHETIIPIR